MRELRMMFRLLAASAKSQVMYRADFLIGVIGTLFYNATFLLSIGVLTSRFQSIGGWSMWELVLLYALFELGHTVYGFFLSNMTTISRHVMDGTLDVYFLRPYGILTQLNGSKMNYTVFVDGAIGVVTLCAALGNLNLRFTPLEWLLLVLFVIGGGFIEYALALLLNCASMRFANARSLWGAYYQLILIAQRYPLSIFSRGFQGVLTFLCPLGFMNYYPALFLLRKPNGWIGCFAPLAAVALTALALKIFAGTLKYYASTGS